MMLKDNKEAGCLQDGRQGLLPSIWTCNQTYRPLVAGTMACKIEALQRSGAVDYTRYVKR